jgi:predicted nucleic acid-binding protein
MVLIWGLKLHSPNKTNGARVTEMLRKAGILFTQLEKTRPTIIVPSIVVAEVLVKVDPSKHSQFISEVADRFICPPFSVNASVLAAQLWTKHRSLPKDQQIARRCLKVDVLIVASAKLAGARWFYSDEAKLRSLADSAGMIGRDLPTHHEDMFDLMQPGSS